MFQSINEYDFRQSFHAMNRGDNFSYEGLTALFDYLEDYEESTGESLELDVIGLCCDFCEYSSAIEAVQEYDNGTLCDIIEQGEEACLDWLADNTTALSFDGGVIIKNF